ncbi:hypothetical protein BDM02DRAFT_3092285 [Thelephora ganbajun]|uniref:Uncharacterized protein n=1 Tax=Thelephora ganbajun TaxID=370292 RepID=A0ACB6ZN72_THEGA|nr:hypothetical protein BDM02DRAFT_3092285 [Thelephora ganbajun]
MQAVHSAAPLSTTQERRLVYYLEEQFLELTRGYKKRSHPSSRLTTLPAYLEASHHLLNLILQIPPIDPSASLRSTLLLRLTGEILDSVSGYTPDEKSLSILLDWLQDLDKGWLAVLRSQGWDSAVRSGISVQLPNGTRPPSLSQTECTRLKSMLVAGTEMLEEWVELLQTQPGEGETWDSEITQGGRLEDLFSRTLAEMGFLRGEFST